MLRALDELARQAGANPRAFWHTVVDTMNEALLVVDPQRRIVYSNQKAQELIGLSQEQACGQLCVDAISCPQCECTCRLFEQGQINACEVKIYHPATGEQRIFLKNGRLLKDGSGQVIGGVETFQDITAEAQQREQNVERIEQLFHQKKRYESLIGSLSEGVVSIDAGYRVREFSRRMTELTGYTEDEAVGVGLYELLGVPKLAAEPGRLDSLAGRAQRFEARTKDGRFIAVELAFRAIRFNQDELLGLLRPLADEQPADRIGQDSFHGILTRSAGMRRMFSLIESAAASDVTILIEGESGTGKELIARAIHRLSDRRDQPFSAINCATFTGSLLLSELFGHERGAFTGAIRKKRGKFELAGRGSLFLDEVSEIPIQHQSLLLRVLEERTFERVGGHAPIQMHARVIAATNRNLSQALSAGTFREDLYYRLKVVPIQVPTLRERPEDIELLAGAFLQQAARTGGQEPKQLAPRTLEILQAHGWPGNVRELRNLIEFLMFTAGERIEPEDLPKELSACAQGPDSPACREASRDGAERQRVLEALRLANFKRSRAADLLGINRSTLYRKICRLGIQV
jgi:PAS domain S-box-containing protein